MYPISPIPYGVAIPPIPAQICGVGMRNNPTVQADPSTLRSAGSPQEKKSEIL